MPLLREKPNKPVKPMIITPVNTSGFVLKNKVSLVPLYLLLQNDVSALSLYEAQAEAKAALRNIPITNEEWAEIISLFQDLNKYGFVHKDLAHNIYFRRNEEGKLIITIIDFENVNVPMEKDDRVGLDEIRLKLEMIGAKERFDENEDIDILDEIRPKPKLKLQNLLMPALSIGLGLTALINGVAEPALAFAGIPFFASFNRPAIMQKAETDKPQVNLKTITSAIPIPDWPYVMKLKNLQGDIVAYFKRTNGEEVKRTKLFDKIVKEKNLQNKFSHIEFEYPALLSTSLSDLPKPIAQFLKSRFKEKTTYGNMLIDILSFLFLPQRRQALYDYNLITAPVNTSGFVLGNKFDNLGRDLFSIRKEAMTALKGQPITVEEWQEINNLFFVLNNAGFYHTDLIHNLFFRRNEQGKLLLTIIDFEDLNIYNSTNFYDDLAELNRIAYLLESIDLKYQ